MADYQKLYFRLFTAIADAVEEIEKVNYGNARGLLIKAQQEAEEEYIGEE